MYAWNHVPVLPSITVTRAPTPATLCVAPAPSVAASSHTFVRPWSITTAFVVAANTPADETPQALAKNVVSLLNATRGAKA
jgi:hypothetical protein